MKHRLIVFVAIAAIAVSPHLRGQGNPISPASISSLVRSSTEARSGSYSPSSIVLIKNRAHVLGAQASPAATRYFAVSDADLLGMSSEEILRRLSPTEIKAGDGVRRVDIVVDLQRSLTIRADTLHSPVNIGTAVVKASAATKHIEVRASIFTTGVTVIGK